MSVYTSLSNDDIIQLLKDYDLGDFVSLQGIAQGITNSNYFLTTKQGKFVLTVFETLKQHEIPFFLELKQHLSSLGVACPQPVMRLDGQFDSVLVGKPACIVSCLNGSDTGWANREQCFAVGAMLAKMHLAGQSFNQEMPNPRYRDWWRSALEQLQPYLEADEYTLLEEEIAFIDQSDDSGLPHGIIHADLFKDNVLLDGNQVAGFIDFYYACSGNFMYDLAIAVNDWARTAQHSIDLDLADALLKGYCSVRSPSPAEWAFYPVAERAACIRFWVSRLLDFHFPQDGALTFIKDPNDFKTLLLHHREQDTLSRLNFSL